MTSPRFTRPTQAKRLDIAAVTGAYVVFAMWLGLRGTRRIDMLLGAQDSRVSASGMISILSAIASGMIAFTGIVFSLAMVALQFGSTTYGPRIYAALGGGRRMAHAVGIFAGTFVFALMAIWTVDVRGSATAPQVIPWISLAWLLASVGATLFVLPEVVQLSVGRVLRDLGERGRHGVARVYPQPHVARVVPKSTTSRSVVISKPPVRHIVEHRGPAAHLVGFDVGRLVAEARRARALIRIPLAIGDTIEPGQPLAIVHAWGRGHVSVRRIRRAVWVGETRATDNDPAYALRLLVDTAIRALSPGINDPTTAVDALDRIEPILAALGRAQLDIGHVSEGDEETRLVFGTPTWEELVDLALAEIAHYGRNSSQVRRRLRLLVRRLVTSLDPSRHLAFRHVLSSPPASEEDVRAATHGS